MSGRQIWEFVEEKDLLWMMDKDLDLDVKWVVYKDLEWVADKDVKWVVDKDVKWVADKDV